MTFNIYEDIHYKAIKEYYKDSYAERSGLPYMKHINEGIDILKQINASHDAIKAFCIHPLFQEDDLLKKLMNDGILIDLDPRVVSLAFIYRETANSYLSEKTLTRKLYDNIEKKLKEYSEVRDMLIADKVQNKFDFMLNHYEMHERSEELLIYFNDWLDDLLNADYHELKKVCNI